MSNLAPAQRQRGVICASAGNHAQGVAAAAESAACYGRLGTCVQEFGTLASWGCDLVNLLTGNLDRPGGVMFTTPAAPMKASATKAFRSALVRTGRSVMSAAMRAP